MKARNERNRKLDILKNKKLVKILNHKMFKGYRDIKASKWFFNQKPKFISQLAWENKIFDPFDELYNLNYKMNVLYPLKNPTFDNILFIQNYPPKEKKVFSQQLKEAYRPKTSINSFSSSNKNLSTIDSKNRNKMNLYNNKKNFYLTSMSIYETDNFFPETNPKTVYKQIFENDKVIYNDIPILSLDKVKSLNKIRLKKNKKDKKSKNKNRKKFEYVNTNKNEIIQTNNIHDDVYNGLTEKQFLYKISHNKLNKNIEEKININAFRKNKGFVKGFVSKRLKSALPSQPNLASLTLNKKVSGPKGVTIELEYDNTGNMRTKKLFTTSGNNLLEEIINGKNNYLIYNGGNKSSDSNKIKFQSRAKSSSNKDSETENSIFGKPFKNIEKNNKKKENLEPPIKYFENKPRIFDDKLLLQFQLDKKNNFLKLKQIME